jgi:hypothetical protein
MTWSTHIINSTVVSGIYVNGTNKLVSCGNYGSLYTSSNDGISWTYKNTSLPNMWFFGIDFTDSLHGFVTGGNRISNNNGIVLYTSDGGINWSSTYINNAKRLTSVHFNSENNGYTVSLFGGIYKYTQPSASINKNKANQFEFSIFPNPTTNFFTINIENGFDKKTQVNILNLDGKLVYSDKLISNKTKIDLSNYGSGIYFVSIVLDGNKMSTKKIIVN